MVAGVSARPGDVFFGVRCLLPGRKVATVFEDPGIQAADTEINRGFTRELYIHGTGFTNVVQPILMFAPPLDDAAVNIHVSRARSSRSLWRSATRIWESRVDTRFALAACCG